MPKKFFQTRIVNILLVIVMLFSLHDGSVKAAPDITFVTISNVVDVSFVVSWVTTTASNGTVRYGTSTPPTLTQADSVASTTTHYVTVSGLLASHTYYFQVESGADVNNNGGSYFQVTTGPTLSIPPTGNNVYGYLYQSNGTTIVPDALVYLRIRDANGSGSPGDSQRICARTNGSGLWSFSLNQIRTNDFSSYYAFTTGTDNLQMIGQGGSAGSRGIETPYIISVPPNNTRLDLNLIQAPTAVKMSSFTGTSRFGEVQLNWQTASEMSLVGFNVYRSATIAGIRSKLNSTLIPAQDPGQLVGGGYNFSDSVVPGQHNYYWLEWIDSNPGQPSTTVGPVDITYSYMLHLPLILK